MTDNPTDMALFITKLPEILMATGAILAAYWSYKAKQQGKENGEQIEVVRQEVDGKMQELLKVTGESEKAKGFLEGQADTTLVLSPDEVVKVKLVDEQV